MLSGLILPPVLVHTQSANPGTVSTYTVTPSVAPTEGNWMFVILGGSQTRTCTPPAGWTSFVTVNTGGGSLDFFRKQATSSEPGSYNFVYGGNLQGGFSYFEFQNCDIPSLVSQFHPSTGAVTSKAYTTYNVSAPSVAFAALAMKSATIIDPLDSGFTTICDFGRFSCAYKIYSDTLTGESPVWTHALADSLIGLGIVKGAQGV